MKSDKSGAAPSGTRFYRGRNFIRGSHRRADTGFTLVASFEEAVRLARYGWEKALRQVSDMANRIVGKIDTFKSSYRWDTSGLFFDAGAVLAGEQE